MGSAVAAAVALELSGPGCAQNRAAPASPPATKTLPLRPNTGKQANTLYFGGRKDMKKL